MIQLYKRILYSFIFLLAALGSSDVFAEGSKDLYPSGIGGNRAFLMSHEGSLGATSGDLSWPFRNYGVHYVYAKAGEVIAIASSANGIGSGAIRYTSPDGSVVFTSTGTAGQIANRTAELAGPQYPGQGAGGNRYLPVYTPTVTAATEGVWKIEFLPVSNAPTAPNTATQVGADAAWTQPSANDLRIYIAAWDVSVRNAANTAWVSGRVYTNVLNFGIANDFTGATNGVRGFAGKVYPYTKDGYTYQVDNNGSVGVYFTFFVNNKGFTTAGAPDYKSINGSDAAALNGKVQDPRNEDTATDITHKIFYGIPDQTMPATANIWSGSATTTTWLVGPRLVPTISNLQLLGKEGTPNQVSNKGGTVKFDANLVGQYTIKIESTDAVPAFPTRTITGFSTVGTNSVVWDGKDGSGNPLPSGNFPAKVSNTLQGAEVHFPYIDMEVNPNGIKIQLYSSDFSTFEADKVFWDDSNISGATSGTVEHSNPANNSQFVGTGISSLTNGHKWGSYTASSGSGNSGKGLNSFGNEKSMDTWTFVTGATVTESTTIAVKTADLKISSVTPSPTSVNRGQNTTVTVVAQNDGPDAANGATFAFTVPTGFEIVSATPTSGCAVQTTPTISADLLKFSAKLDMPNGCSVSYAIVLKATTTASYANNTIKATILRPADVTDPDATDPNSLVPSDPDSECANNGLGGACNNIKTSFVTVNNILPTASPDVNSTNINTTLTVNAAQGVLANDSDTDGGTLSVTKYTIAGTDYTAGTAHLIPGKGTITINANGSYTFVPVTGYTGPVDVITYTLSDGTGTATSTLTLTVNPTNVAPVANPDTNSTNEDVTLTVNAANGVLANDTDADSDPLSVTKFTIAGIAGDQTVGTPVLIAGKGTITLNANGSYTFVPVANFNGAVPVITYTVTDGTVTTTSTLTLTVNPLNDPPVAVADVNSTNEDVTLTVNAANGVLANDSDVDGDALSVTKYTIAGIAGDQTVGTPVLIAGKGTITLNANGSYTFVPVANFNGAVPVITYTITDGTVTTTSTLTLTVNPLNDPPVAIADVNSTNEDVTLTVNAANGVLANDSDVDGDALSVTKYTIAGIAGDQTVGTPVLIAGKGTITLNANGSYTFVPVANFNGAVPVITYTITDGTVTTTSTLTLTVNPLNDPPVAVADVNSTNEDVTLTVNAANGVLANDSDVDGDALSVTKYTIAGIAGDQTVGTPVLIAGKGTITLNADGSYTFVPVANFNGAVPVITYTITDGTVTTTSTLTLTVNPLNDPPVAVADVNSTNEDVTLTVNAANGVLANDTDVDGDALTVTKYTIAGIAGDQTVGTPVLIAGKGTITLNGDGSYTFVPVANFNGAVPVITYTITDGTVTTTSTLTLTVNPVNDPPVANPDTNTMLEDGSLTVAAPGLLTNDTDVEGDALTVTKYTIAGITGDQTVGTPVVIAGQGTITINANGSYTFVPVANFNGAVAEVTYTISDGNGGTQSSTLNITVTPVNDAPAFTKGANQAIGISATAVVRTVNNWATGLSKGPADENGQTLNFVTSNNNNALFNVQPAIDATGNLTYTPAPNKYGKATVSVTLYDNGGTANGGVDASATQTFDIVIKPVGTGDADITPVNTAVTTTVVSNDGASGIGTTVVKGTDPSHGTITVNPDGTITYEPATDYVGTDAYTYILRTADGVDSDPIAVNILVYKATIAVTKDGVYNDTNGDGKVNVGDRINYTFVVTNTGTVAVTNITLSDANATIAGGPIASLAAGASNNSTFTGYHVLTQADIDNSGVYNSATATGKDPKNNNVTASSTDPTPLAPGDPNYPVTPPTPACPTCTITPIVQTGSMSLAKEGVYNDTNGDGKVNIGDRINYTFVVTNTGNVTLTNVTLTDNNATVAGGPIASLAPGASNNSTFTAYHVLTQADFDNGGVFNLATAKAKDPKNNDVTVTSNDPTPLNPGDPGYPVTPPTPACPTCTVTPVTQIGSLTLAKEGTFNDFNADGKINVGDRINYTFVVTNTGNVTLTNITLSDNNATLAGGPIASLAPGASNNSTFTGYHVITQADIDNGGVFNLATAKGKDPRNNDVTVTSNDPTPLNPGDPGYPVTPPTPACPTCTVTPIVQLANMTLAKEGSYNDTNADGKVNVGDRINYTFVVTNTGNVTLTNVTVTDNNATIAGGPIASLAPGASNNSTFTGYHVLTQADIDNGGVFNLATVKGKDPRNNDVSVTSNDPTPLNPGDPGYPVTPPTPACPTCTVTPITQTGTMTLAKEGSYFDFNGDGKVNVGDRINYTFVVTNTGNVTLTNVTITDNNATVVGGPLATLAPGASNNSTFTAYHVLTQADIDNGGVFNTATAKGKDPRNNDVTTTSNDPTPLNPGDPGYPVTPPTPACPTCTVTPIVQTGSMSLAKDGVYNDTNGDGKVNAGDRINYTFVVTNTGNVTLTNVTVTDNNATVLGGPIATLAAGDSDNTTFVAYHVLTQADIDNGGVYNLATVKAKDPRNNDVTSTSNDPTPLAPGDPNTPITPPTPACPTCTVTPIVQTGSMSLAKEGTYQDTNADGKVNVGDRINYTFVVTNTGNVTLTNVTLSDNNATVAGGPIASLAVGASDNSTFTAYHVLTQADIDNGGVFNLATVKGKDPRNNDVTTTSVDPTPVAPGDPGYPVTPPTPACPTCTVTPITQTGSMTLAKEGVYNDTNGDGKVNIGDRINYTFVVTNTGNVTLTNVTVTDNNATVTGGPIASLAPGASNNTTFTAYHTLTQADFDNGGVFNLATAKAKDPKNNDITTTSNDPSPLNPGDPGYPVTPPTPACPTCTVTPIVQTGSMSLAKEGVYNDTNGDGKVNVGDRINYTFVVTNTGNVTLTNITLTDNNATVTGGPIVSLAVGASDNSTFTAYHVLTQADIDNGGVFNTATAKGKDPRNNDVTTTSNDPTPVNPGDPGYPVTPPTPACPTCTVTPIVQTGSMSLAKEGTYNDTNGDGKVNVGDRINYTFVVTNTGNLTLTNVTLTDANATVTGGPIATLAVGASDNSTFTAYHVLTQADIDNGGVFNLATAKAKDPRNNDVTVTSNDPTPVAPGDPVYPVTPPTPACPTCTVTPITQTGSMSLAKEGTYDDTNGDGKVNIGDRINYTFVVTNTGNVTLTNITVTDNNATVAGGPIASLAPGASNNNTFTAYHVLTQADLDNGGVFNTATAKGKDPRNNDVTTTSNDPTPVNPGDPGYPVTPPTPACPTCTVTPITQTGSMSLAKEGTYDDTNGDGKVNIGDRINYTFVVTNTGNVTLTNITVTDNNATVAGGPIASLAPGASNNSTFTAYHVITQADIDNGGVFNTATAKGKDPRNNDVTTTSNDPSPLNPGDPGYPVTPPTPACPTCTVTPIVQTGSMSLAKEGVYNDTNGDGKVNVGDRINYTFVVTNTGNVSLTNITLTDANATVSGGPIASLAVGASNNSTFTAYHVLTQADIDNGGVFNTATAKGKDPRNNDVTVTSNDPTPVNPGDPGYPVTPPTPACPSCTVTPLTQTSGMTITKDGVYSDTNGDGKVNVGDRINYTFVITNTGNVTLTNLSVSDANATVLGGPLASLAPGAVDKTTFTAYHVLTQADLDNRGVFNLATASATDPRNNTIKVTSTDPTPVAPTDPNYPITPPTPACPTCTVTPIVQTGAIALVKKVTNTGTGVGGAFVLNNPIEYTFTITNTGNVTLGNITLTDPLLGAGVINVAGTLAPGASTTVVRTYTITAADIAKGNVTNQATVNAIDPANKPVTDLSGTGTTNDTPTVTTLAKPPVANNDSATTRQNDPIKIAIESNDVAGSTPIVPASIVITVQPKHGTVTINADGTVTYTPNAGYVGADDFTYTVKDTNGQTSNPAVVNISVVASKPKAVDDADKTQFNKPVVIPVIKNDIKDGAELDPTKVEVITQPKNGTVKINTDGTITYTPNSGFTGKDTFTYRVRDAYGNWTDVANVEVTVEGFFIPNVITPDGDGKNDFFVIVGLPSYDRVEVEFYNRWGNQVYTSKNYQNNWNGEGLNEGTYYYTIRLIKGNTSNTIKGWVLIKR